MKHFFLMAFVAVISSGCSVSSTEADLDQGKKKARMCAGCHGVDGISIVPIYPNLKGQHAAYTAKQLRAYKNKTRRDSVMNAQASLLSEEDIINISAYYENLGKVDKQATEKSKQ
jgi:cytochrome c553